MQTLLLDGDQQIGAERDAYLGFDRVLGTAPKDLDVQVLFHPLEE